MNSEAFTERSTASRASARVMGRINTDIFRILTMCIGEKSDAHILRVEASKDLSTAKVFVNDDVDKLNGNVGFFKTAIANGMKIRKVPNIRFILDDGEKNTKRVEELLERIHKGK